MSELIVNGTSAYIIHTYIQGYGDAYIRMVRTDMHTKPTFVCLHPTHHPSRMDVGMYAARPSLAMPCPGSCAWETMKIVLQFAGCIRVSDPFLGKILLPPALTLDLPR